MTSDPENSTAGSSLFLDERSGGGIAYARALITIPEDHRMGEIEAPGKFLGFLWRLPARVGKHFTVHKIELLDQVAWSAAVNEVAQDLNDRGLLFVHGFNVSFVESLNRAAQLKYDLGIPGPVTLFSWSSQGTITDYTADKQTAEWSALRLAQLLRNLVELPDMHKLDILAHSMGNRVLSIAANELDITDEPQLGKVDNIILAAPDLDAQLFREKIAPVFMELSRELTLYASSNDKAIKISRKLNRYRILGDTSEGVFVLDGVTSIDASEAKTSFLGHSYFGDSDSIIADIYEVIRGIELPRLNLKSAAGGYWTIKPR